MPVNCHWNFSRFKAIQHNRTSTQHQLHYVQAEFQVWYLHDRQYCAFPPLKILCKDKKQVRKPSAWHVPEMDHTGPVLLYKSCHFSAPWVLSPLSQGHSLDLVRMRRHYLKCTDYSAQKEDAKAFHPTLIVSLFLFCSYSLSPQQKLKGNWPYSSNHPLFIFQLWSRNCNSHFQKFLCSLSSYAQMPPQQDHLQLVTLSSC